MTRKPPRTVEMPGFCLDRLMPMHLMMAASGDIQSVGTTLRKLDPDSGWIGRHFLDVFVVRRPGSIHDLSDLRARAGKRIYLGLRDGSQTGLRGMAVPLANGGGMLLNLSFGVTVLDAVRRYRLTEADFAPTDLAVELLYMVEVKTTLMEDLRQLNHKLEGAKTLAEEEAQTDTLTGLRNRRALDMALENILRSGQPFALLHMDLDYFKAVNDTLGHPAGDHVLRAVAQILMQETREGDTIARVGGDEFVLILPGVTLASRLHSISSRIITHVTRPIDYQGQRCRISASIGITVSHHYAQPAPADMLADADMALYASKRAGRGQARMFQSLERIRAIGQ